MTTEHTVAAPAGERSLADSIQTARDDYRTEIRAARGGTLAAEGFTTRVDDYYTI